MTGAGTRQPRLCGITRLPARRPRPIVVGYCCSLRRAGDVESKIALLRHLGATLAERTKAWLPFSAPFGQIKSICAIDLAERAVLLAPDENDSQAAPGPRFIEWLLSRYPRPWGGENSPRYFGFGVSRCLVLAAVEALQAGISVPEGWWEALDCIDPYECIVAAPVRGAVSHADVLASFGLQDAAGEPFRPYVDALASTRAALALCARLRLFAGADTVADDKKQSVDEALREILLAMPLPALNQENVGEAEQHA